MPKFPWSTLTIAVVTLVVSWQSMVHPRLLEAVWYSKAAVAEGELWRLVGGHLVHHNASHLILNLAAFVILALFIESQKGSVYLAKLFVFTGLIVSLGLYWVVPEIEYYAGISALNYGLLAWLALKNDVLIFKTEHGAVELNTASTVIGLLVLYSAYQWWQGATLNSTGAADSEIVVAWQVHLLSIAAITVHHLLNKSANSTTGSAL